jgi:Uma2 family endonuclease
MFTLLVSEEEYREREKTSEVKHEYFRGEIFAMSGGSNAHAVIGGNIVCELKTKLRGTDYRPINSQQMIKVEATGLHTYPDVSVYCHDARFEGKSDQVLLTPVAIFEVLSPSTANYDRGEKFDHYKQMPSLQDYVLIAQERMAVDHFQRLENGDWLLRSANQPEAGITLSSIGVTLELKEIYDDVDVPPGLTLLREKASGEEQS